MYIISHAKGTYFPLARISTMIPPFQLETSLADPVTEGPAQWLSPSLPASKASLSLGEPIITVNSSHIATNWTKITKWTRLLPSHHVVDSEVTTTVLLILNQLQLKNYSAGLKERPSPVYQVLTMTRQNHKDRILDIKLEKMIPILPQWKAAPLVQGSTTVAHTGVLYSCHFLSLKAHTSYVHWQLRWREGDLC